MKYKHANKSILIFFLPIMVIVSVGLIEEITSTSLYDLELSYVYDVLIALGIALWGWGVLLGFLSFSKKEGLPKRASAGVILNLVAFLGTLGAFGNYL